MGIPAEDQWYLDALPVGARAELDGVTFIKDVNGTWVKAPAEGVKELLSEDKFEDVEGMRFGMGIVIGAIGFFVLAGAVLGVTIGVIISIVTGKFL